MRLRKPSSSLATIRRLSRGSNAISSARNLPPVSRQARRPVAPLLTASWYSLTMLVVSPAEQRQVGVLQADAGPSPTQTLLLLSIRTPLGPPQAWGTPHTAGPVPTKPPLPMPPV